MGYLRVVARGRLGVNAGTSKEEWSCSMSFLDDAGHTGVTPWDTAHYDAAAEACRGDWATLFGDAEMRINTNVSLDEVRVYHYNFGVKDAIGIGYSAPAEAPVTGPNSDLKPFQVSNVITFKSINSRAKPTTGRIFLPPQGNTINPDGTFAASTAQHYKGTVEQLALALGASLAAQAQTPSQTAYQHVIVSSKPGQGTQHVVDYLCGVVPDTMRSRRRSLVENYQ